jgi:hypothetical protein
MSARHAAAGGAQLQLALVAPEIPAPRTAEELLAVMVSYRGEELRVHRGYLAAPIEVLRAIVVFVRARRRAERRAAQRVILRYSVGPTKPPVRRREPARPSDAPVVRELAAWHRTYNERHFGGALTSIPIRLSGRMRSRLGQYSAPTAFGDAAEITISRQHVRRHGWEEVLHTLLHEMVHQWQQESGLTIDHGAAFRAKAREVGVAPRARRELRLATTAGQIYSPQEEILLRAARRE